ncbi:hypothetical protein BVI2075_840005 [Burkholderia vietnamiensis]|nr:hypothetical protein BVI2075_840005 [Burkholderia vietnamiensis]
MAGQLASTYRKRDFYLVEFECGKQPIRGRCGNTEPVADDGCWEFDCGVSPALPICGE